MGIIIISSKLENSCIGCVQTLPTCYKITNILNKNNQTFRLFQYLKHHAIKQFGEWKDSITLQILTAINLMLGNGKSTAIL